MPASTLPGYTVHTGPGWVNNSGRAFGNGPMDETTQRMIDFVDWYDANENVPQTDRDRQLPDAGHAVGVLLRIRSRAHSNLCPLGGISAGR